MREMDERLMRRAVAIAAKAREHGNHPFGALLADEKGNIQLEAENTVVTEKDCTGHAETNLMRKACRKYDPNTLAKCTLYTSTEPCPMCTGAIFWGNVGRIVFGLSEKRLYEIGLFEGRFPKDYLDYFDTVQLLFAAAETEGYSWKPVERASSQDAVHLGGTSFSAYGAKDVAQLYIHLRFLEISCAEIQRHYAPLVAPYQSAAVLVEQLSDAGQRSTAKAVDALIERLQSRLACAGDAGKGAVSLKR